MRRFLGDESGFITVEWVVLLSGLTLLAFVTVRVIAGGTEDIGINVSQTLADAPVGGGFARPAPPDDAPEEDG